MNEPAHGLRLHRLATALILIGFAMLCQPLTVTLYAWGFPVMLLGVLLFVFADHLPTKYSSPDENSNTPTT